MNDKVWWYLARSSGLVAWLMLAASVIWGVLLSTRLLQDRRRPAWLLSLHRWLGGLSVSFASLHLLGLVLDDYVQFGPGDLFVPFASEWKPGAVAWGVVALYLLAAVQVTSLAMRRLPKRLWRAVHLTSFGLFWTASMHAAGAGTDATQGWYRAGTAVVITAVVFVAAYRVLAPSRRRRAPAAAEG